MSVINPQNVMLPVKIDVVKISIRKKRPTTRTLDVWWPVLKLSSWISTLLSCRPEVLLCGFQPEDTEWRNILSTFWSYYEEVNPDHELYADNSKDRACCLPYMLHGDEGRGLRNKPLWIESFQPVIGHKGSAYTNEAGHLRFIAGNRISDSM